MSGCEACCLKACLGYKMLCNVVPRLILFSLVSLFCLHLRPHDIWYHSLSGALASVMLIKKSLKESLDFMISFLQALQSPSVLLLFRFTSMAPRSRLSAVCLCLNWRSCQIRGDWWAVGGSGVEIAELAFCLKGQDMALQKIEITYLVL